MDKQTEIMWEEEFQKQYPKPDYEILGLQELFEVNRILFEFRNPEVMDALNRGHDNNNPWRYLSANDTYSSEVYNNHKIYKLKYEHEQDMKPWNDWRQECYDRFDAIFSASPVYALEELRKGNLLIEENK